MAKKSSPDAIGSNPCMSAWKIAQEESCPSFPDCSCVDVDRDYGRIVRGGDCPAERDGNRRMASLSVLEDDSNVGRSIDGESHRSRILRFSPTDMQADMQAIMRKSNACAGRRDLKRVETSDEQVDYKLWRPLIIRCYCTQVHFLRKD